jgi:hypothetical protein
MPPRFPAWHRAAAVHLRQIVNCARPAGTQVAQIHARANRIPVGQNHDLPCGSIVTTAARPAEIHSARCRSDEVLGLSSSTDRARAHLSTGILRNAPKRPQRFQEYPRT